MTSIRLLAFSNIIAPYRVAFFNEINRQADITLHVAYLARTEPNRSWTVNESDIRYPHSVIPGLHLNLRRDKTLHLNVGVCGLFGEFMPNIVFLGTDMLILAGMALGSPARHPNHSLRGPPCFCPCGRECHQETYLRIFHSTHGLVFRLLLFDQGLSYRRVWY